MPNAIAYLALLAWPLVTVALFRRLPVDRALIVTMIAGYLVLPEPPAMFDFPLLPPFTKHNIPAFAAFVCLLWMHGKPAPLLPESKLGKILVILFITSPVLTVVTNAEPVIWGRIWVPGLTIKDAFALTITQFLLILPFLMARQHLASGGSQRTLLVAFLVGGLVYSLPMLIEMRLSPQLNLWVYGYYQHQFGQSIRFGGYRPLVFLYHGLWTAFFIMTSVVAAWALWKFDKARSRIVALLIALYLTAILVLAKSLGALIFAVGLVPIVLFFGSFAQLRIAALIASLALSYPLLKSVDLVPDDWLLAKAEAIDPDRAGSLQFRFDNENTLLERAQQKPLFGWGHWGRNHIMDPVSGILLTVSDGRWIITVGVFGWVGFFAEFGLILLPIYLLLREAMATRRAEVTWCVGPLTLILAINVFDMIPNATLTPLTWLVAGALLGYAEQLKAARIKLEQSRTFLQWRSVM